MVAATAMPGKRSDFCSNSSRRSAYLVPVRAFARKVQSCGEESGVVQQLRRRYVQSVKQPGMPTEKWAKRASLVRSRRELVMVRLCRRIARARFFYFNRQVMRALFKS